MRQPGGTRALLRRVPGIVVSLVLPVFLVLKLAGAVGWSWWWVLSPLWICALAGALAATAFTLVRWAVRAWVWLRFRRRLLPELSLADPAMWDRIEAERPVARQPEGAEPGS